MDGHLNRRYFQNESTDEGSFGDGFAGGTSFDYSGQGYGDGFDRGHVHRLYSRLMTNGQYAELDKAKHNEQYRNYLLENYEDDSPLF